MSPVETLLRHLVEFGEHGHTVLDGLLDELTTSELAALWHDDWTFWARPNQLIPSGAWRTYGFMAGRGWGKSRSAIEFLLAEVDSGRARRVALVAPSELKAIEIFVSGASGILTLAPRWLAPAWESSSNVVRFSNGAIATVYSAEAPDNLRGPEHDLALATEIAAWPASTRDETLSNLRRGLRLGDGRLVWDSTPRRRNPLIRLLLAEQARDPERHVVVRGESRENRRNLAVGIVEDWELEIGGTARGAEELEGRYLDEAEDALFRQAWIDRARRPVPDRFTRRIISIDPAITDRRGSDSTGIVELGLGVDGQVFVLSNHTGKHSAGAWPGLVLDQYVQNACDLIVVETNRGGSTFEQLLRHAAKERNRELIMLAPDGGGLSRARPDVVFVRPVHARGQKSERASGASALVERGRVSFVAGRLGDLEERLCLFDGASGRPDDAVDAFVHGVRELALAGRPDRQPITVPRAFPTKFRTASGGPGFQW